MCIALVLARSRAEQISQSCIFDGRKREKGVGAKLKDDGGGRDHLLETWPAETFRGKLKKKNA